MHGVQHLEYIGHLGTARRGSTQTGPDGGTMGGISDTTGQGSPKRMIDEPEYARAARIIRERIRAGQYQVGTRLPVWHALAEELGISPSTIQRSAKQLRAEGWISGGQGKQGALVISAEGNVQPSIEDRMAALEARLGRLEADLGGIRMHSGMDWPGVERGDRGRRRRATGA